MMRSTIVLICLVSICCVTISCNSIQRPDDKLADDFTRQKELDEKELRLKEAELQIRHEAESLRVANEQPSLAKYYQDNKDAVWLILAANDEQIALGSAFVINEAGVAITNNHVLEDADAYLAVSVSGERRRIDRIYVTDPSVDYAIFHIEGNGRPFNHVRIAQTLPEVGEDCFAIGNPKGFTATLSKGIVSGLRAGGDVIQTTAEITHGSSGGPLFNASGEVIGITTAGYETADLNFAVNIQKVPYQRFNYSFDINSDTAHFARTRTMTTPTAEAAIEDARKSVDAYFEFNQQHYYVAMGEYLAPTLNVFFGKKNISREQAVEESRAYDRRKGIKVVSYKIHWEDAYANAMPDGVIFKFTMNFSITSIDPSLPNNMLLEMTIRVNRQLKIDLIKERILNKS